ncbi:MAG TPA: MarR family transcriptional regulator [Gemmatimonadaceae bacterium]
MATHTTRRASPARAPRQPDELTAALDGIRRIVQALRVSARAAERRLGISGAQLFVLHTLSEAPAESLNDLAARTFTHQSSVSVVVDRLVRRKLVSRTRSPEDGRRVVLELTPAGRRLIRSSPEVAQIRLIEALRALPASDCRSLSRMLHRIVRDMGVTDLPGMLFEESRRGPRTAARAARPRNAGNGSERKR